MTGNRAILLAALAAALVPAACPGCIVFFRKEFVRVPDPEAHLFVEVAEVQGRSLTLPDGETVDLAGADLSGLSRFQRQTFFDHLSERLPKGRKVLLFPQGRERARVVCAEPMRLMYGCFPVISLFPIKVEVPPRRLDVLAECLERGLVRLDPRQVGDGDFRLAYIKAEQFARANKRGVWATKADQLLFAAEKGAADEVARLLDEGVDINTADGKGLTALHRAAKGGHPDVLAALIRRGADVSAKAEYDQTPLDVAGRFGRRQAVAFLLDSGVRIDSQALQCAAVYRQREIVELLLDRGAGLPEDDSLIGALSRAGDLRIVHLLLTRGAPFDPARHGPDLLVEAVLEQRRPLVALLLDKGVNPNAPNRGGNRPLDVAAGNGMVEIARLLIAYGADVNQKDRRGHRPLRLARKHKEMVALLRRHGAR